MSGQLRSVEPRAAAAAAAQNQQQQQQQRPFGHFTCCEVATTCQPPSAWRKDPWPATIRGICNGGLRLSLERRFEKGSGLAIELPTEDGETTTVLARVTEIEAMPGGGAWLLGCSFISELSDEEVRLVLRLDPVRQAPLSDAVAAEGQGGLGADSWVTPSVNGVLFQARGPSSREVLRWYVKRLDLSGRWPLQRGKVMSMRVGGLPADSAPLGLCVRDCRLFGSYWIVDCALLAEPSPDVRDALNGPAAALATNS